MKTLLKIVGVIVLVVVLAIVGIIALFDLNKVKPHLESAARTKGIELSMAGDLSWRFWPSIGLSVADVSVAAVTTPKEPIAAVSEASLLVQLMPLLRGQLVVDHVLVDGANISLAVNKQGVGNWQSLLEQAQQEGIDPAEIAANKNIPETATSDREPTAASGTPLDLAIDRISLTNSALNYRDAQSGQAIELSAIDVDIKNFNIEGKAFPATISFTTRLESEGATPLQLALTLEQDIALSNQFENIDLSKGSLSFVLNDKAKGNASYAVALKQVTGDLNYTGSLLVKPLDAKVLLAALASPMDTKEQYALTNVGLEGKFAGTSKAINLAPLTIVLDKTTLNGTLSVSDFSTMALKAALAGDTINVDDYLAPTPSASVASTNNLASNNGTGGAGEVAASVTTGDEELIPVDMIKTLNATAELTFKEIVVAALPFTDIRVAVNAKNGKVHLSEMRAGLFEGSINVNGNLMVEGKSATTEISAKVLGVQLAPALKALALDEKLKLSGGLQADFKGVTHGVTSNKIINSLTGEASFSGAEIRLSPLNVEQKFCELVSLVSKSDVTNITNWQPFTELSELTGHATISNGVLKVDTIKAGVHQLMLGVNGEIDLNQDNYDFMLPLTLLTEETSAQGCRIEGNYWINRSLSLLRCHGDLSTLDPVKDCRPDGKGLSKLVQDFAEFKLREKHGDKIDAAEKKLDDKKDELLNKLDKKLGGEGDGDTAKNLLKGLLKGKKESPADSNKAAEAE